ncbi:type II toxin-antitoxin system RelE/ParE family toxin [Mucilaginibacter terrigena]|uniref:type II toxin-antitoxin system RelE/ParE family toxin n=1 Tax=Mucilaginibacter terrigena TaxID=2492395 RepID=UPI001396C3D9
MEGKKQVDAYSIKLDKLFKESFDIIAISPEIGKPTDFPLVRIKIIRDYLIYYRTMDDAIEILTVLDSRRAPKKLDL